MQLSNFSQLSAPRWLFVPIGKFIPTIPKANYAANYHKLYEMIYLTLLFLAILTIKYLPFINVDASVRFQYWLKRVMRNLEDAIDALDRKQKEKDKNKKKNGD